MSTDPPQQTLTPPGDAAPDSYTVEAPDVERNRLGVNLAWEGLLLVFIALATAAWFLLGGVAFESLEVAAAQLAGVAPYLLLATALAMTLRLGAAHLGLGLYAVLAAGIHANCMAVGMTLPAALGVTFGSIVGLGVLTALLVTVLRVPGWAAGLITGMMGYAVLSLPYGSGFFGAEPSGEVELAPLEPAAMWALIAVAVVLSVAGGALGLVPGLRQVLVNCRDAAAQKGKRGASGVVVTWLGLLGASAIAAGAGIVSLAPNPAAWAITLANGDRILPIAIALGIVLLGGTGLRGGRGGLFGTLLAAIVYYMVGFVMLEIGLQMESYFLLPVGALLAGMVVHWAMDWANRPRRIPGLVYANGVPLLANPPQPTPPEPQHTSLEALLDSRSETVPTQRPSYLVDPAVAAQTPPTLEDPTAVRQPSPPVEAPPEAVAGMATASSDTDAPTAIPRQPDPDATAVVAARQRPEPEADATAAVPAQQWEDDVDATTALAAPQRDGVPDVTVPRQDTAAPDDSTAVLTRQPDPRRDAEQAEVIPAPQSDDTAEQRGDDTAVIPEQADAATAISRPDSANEDDTANIPAQPRGSDGDDTSAIAAPNSEEDDSADTTALPRQRGERSAPDSADTTTALPSQSPETTLSESSVVSESAPPEEDSPDTVKVRPRTTDDSEPSSDDTTELVAPPEPPSTSSNSESYLYRPPT